MNQPQPTLDIDTTPAETPDQQERDRVREIYRARLAEKLKDPEFRKIEGFPIGTDEAILALSDPPFYTACPNPFLEEWLAENAIPYDAATDDYHREPFAADVSEGKNDPIYNAHSYHTKVPHKAIMRYILHYTEPGDVVYDGFCGTGMTGVAAQMCGNKAQVESLGHTVRADGAILDADEQQISRLGARKAILNDLSPAATFIAYNYNTPVDAAAFEREANSILTEVEAECGWMFDTSDVNTKQKGRLVYVVWSSVFTCPVCSSSVIFNDLETDDADDDKILTCPRCASQSRRNRYEYKKESFYDTNAGQTRQHIVKTPIKIVFKVGKKRLSKIPDVEDLETISRCNDVASLSWFPSDLMLFQGKKWGDTYRAGYHLGYESVSDFYFGRTLQVLVRVYDRALLRTPLMRAKIMSLLTSVAFAATHLYKFRTQGGGQPSGNNLYIPALIKEQNAVDAMKRKLRALVGAELEKGLFQQSDVLVSTHSSTCVDNVPDCSVDYIFVDPPFGGNIMYSESNFIWESWLQVFTKREPEAIVNQTQKKGLLEYQELITKCFQELCRVLKPGRWMTVEFHNTANSVWNSIQEGLGKSGLIVADVRVLDKKQSTFKQVTSAGAVKQDLVISCYKPQSYFENRFDQIKGQSEGVLEFVRQHLSMLPIAPMTKGGKLEPVAERTRFLLFDRMIAYHLQRGAPIPMNSADFYKLLEDQFTTRDEMYFLPDQAARYDALKSRGYETEQLSIFLQDEKSAVQWVRMALTEAQQTLGDLTPKFMQELREWPKHEPRPELRDLLREYFIHGDGGVWRVPNPDDEKDIEVLRRSALLRLFQSYTREKGALKTFRKEAVMEGFKQCYETKQYGVIVAICEKIPVKVFQEISEFVMFYDIAKDLAPERVEQIEFVWE